MGLPCLAGKCAADNARKRLASGAPLPDVERADLEVDAAGCDGEQPDPWDRDAKWPTCPAKAAYARDDIDAALTMRGLAAMSPLANWPIGIAARVVETWACIEGERNALREARRE